MPLFAAKGFRATTMKEIADAAGVTKSFIYQHFASKRALDLEITDCICDGLLGATVSGIDKVPSGHQMVEDELAAYFAVVGTHSVGFHLLYSRSNEGDHELDGALLRVEETLAGLLAPLIDGGLSEEHRQLLAYAMVGMAEGASRHWLRTRVDESLGTPATPNQFARRLATVAWAGLRSVHSE